MGSKKSKPIKSNKEEKIGKEIRKKSSGLRVSLGRKKAEIDQEGELESLKESIFPHGDGIREVEILFDVGDRKARDSELVGRVLSGWFKDDGDLVEEKRIVTFFVSSTFDDTAFERNCFLAFVVPVLRELCRMKSLDFRVSEMRWGINKELSGSHQTSAICMKELDRCIEESAAIQLVGILGNRYGYRPFPAEIDCEEFDHLYQVMNDQKVVDKCFKLDENKMVYTLLPIDQIDGDWWDDFFPRLQKEFRNAAIQVFGKDDKRCLPYTQSVTAEEMRRGFESSRENSVLIIREFENAEEIDAKEYTDFDPKDKSGRKIDQEANQLLGGLKEEIKGKAGAVKEYPVVWKSGGLDPKKYPKQHGVYLRNLLSDWGDLVEESIVSVKRFEQDSVFDLQQSDLRFATYKCRDFVGKEQELKEIEVALVQNGCPIVLNGISGCGKTSLCAKLFMDIVPDHGVRIIRFLRATTRVPTLISGLCEQIGRVYGKPDTALPQDINKMIELFHQEYLTLSTPERPLYLFLDSLDQLVEPFDLLWLPKLLPENTFLVLSTLPYLMDKIIIQDQHVVELHPMDFEEIDPVLNQWLDIRNRQLQPHQRQAIHKVVKRINNPTLLLLRILFNEALQWRSYDPIPETWDMIHGEQNSAIHTLFERMERQHGKILTQSCLGLITASRDGLSNGELGDLLSANNHVLKECFEWWIPPFPRVPPLVITRIISALEEYLINSQNTTTWFHRQFREVAKKRYCKDLTHYLEIGDYFSDQLNAKIQAQPPFFLTIKGKATKISKDRQLQPQPLRLQNGNFNQRRLREIGPALIQAKEYGRLLIVLKDTDYVRGMFTISAIQEVIDMLENESLPEQEFRDEYRNALVQSMFYCEKNLDVLEEQLFLRMTNMKSFLKKYVEPNRNKFCKMKGLISNVFESSNSARIATLSGHKQRISSVLVINDHLLATGGLDGIIKIWDYKNLVLRTNLYGHQVGTAVKGLALLESSSSLPRLVSAGEDGTVKLWDLNYEKTIETIENLHKKYEILCLKTNGKHIFTGGEDNRANVYNVDRGETILTTQPDDSIIKSIAVLKDGNHFITGVTVLVLRNLEGDMIQEYRGAKNSARCIAITPEEDFVAAGTSSSHTNETIFLWNLQSGDLVYKFVGKHSSSITDILFTKTLNKRILISLGQGFRLDEYANCWDIDKRTFLGGTMAGLQDVMAVYGKLLFCAGRDTTIFHIDSLAESPGEIETPEFHEKPILSLHPTKDGGFVSTGMDHKVFKIDSKMEKAETTINQQDWVTNSCIVGDTLFTTSGSHRNKENAINAWTLNGKHIQTVSTEKLFPITCICSMEHLDMFATGGNDKKVKLWDAKSFDLIHTFEGHQGFVNDLAALENYVISCSADQTLRIWDVEKKNEIAICKGHKQWISCVESIPEEKLVVSGSWDFTARIWNLMGQCIKVLQGHTLKISSIAISGNKIFTGSFDRTIQLWDFKQDQNQKPFLYPFPQTVVAICSSHDKKKLAVALGNRTLTLLELDF